jgi:hypothetical protein
MKIESHFCALGLLAVLTAANVPGTALAQSCEVTVDADRELLIRDVGVVDDPRASGNGVWSFQHLMEAMAPSPEAAPDMVERLFRSFFEEQVVNGLAIAPRPNVEERVLAPWPRDAAGALDLSQAPVRLLAIVNRLDLRDLSRGQAGEGRFVFGVLDGDGNALQFTLILEYALPASSETEVLEWANLWHGLNGLAPGSEDYELALEQITERFAGSGADPAGVNGSALNQLRTNELIDFRSGLPWELREFRLSASGLEPDTVKLNPDRGFNGTAALAGFVNDNESAILIERHDVPATLDGAPFLAASALNDIDFWAAEGITNNDARQKFSLNTCNGCHGAETGTAFLHIAPREVGAAAALSGFLTQTELPDPVDPSTTRSFNDLARRATDMQNVLCSAVTTGLVERGDSSLLSVGIGRVH